MGYVTFKQSLQYGYRIEEYPNVREEDSFIEGFFIKTQYKKSLIFEIGCPPAGHPGHYFGGVIPVVSSTFIDVLKRAGVDNFQAFPAILVNRKENLQWTDYFAFNAIGLIDAANMTHSKGGVLMGGSDYEGMPALIDFDKLVIDPGKVRGAFMFRELRSPDVLIFDNQVEPFFKKHRPPEGWGITVTKLESIAS